MDCKDIEAYKNKLANEIVKFMAAPMNTRYVEAVDSMVKCYMNISNMQEMITKDFTFTPEKAEKWLLELENNDGTKGAHWTLAQTNAYRPNDIKDYVWECTMNMMYADYCDVATKHGCNTVDFYVNMAKAFLYDKDFKGEPEAKVAAYYNCVVDR